MADELIDARRQYYKYKHANATRARDESRNNLEGEERLAVSLYWRNRMHYWQNVIDFCESEFPELKGK